MPLTPPTVFQSGQITSGHAVQWVADGVVADAGFPAGAANVDFADLPVATTPLEGTELLFASQDGDTVTVTTADIAILAGVATQTIWIPAGTMISRATNGPSIGLTELATNKVMLASLDFDPTTQEYAQFSIRMPKSWNEGTLTFAPSWSHAATTVNFGVVWSLSAVAISDNDPLDVAQGTAQTSSDTGGTTNNLYIGPTSVAITAAGSPQAEDLLIFQVSRVTGDSGDNMAIDARLMGVTVYYRTNTNTDA